MAVDANTASREALMALTGIGGEIADAIVRARPFISLDGLLGIPGIGPSTLVRLREQGLVVLRDADGVRQSRSLRIPVPITQDIGLGDVVKRLTSLVGIRPCRGCDGRAAALNRMFVFSGRRRR